MKKRLLITRPIMIEGSTLHDPKLKEKLEPILLVSMPLPYLWYQMTVCEMNDIENPGPTIQRLQKSFVDVSSNDIVLLLPYNTPDHMILGISQILSSNLPDELLSIGYHIPRSNDKLLEVYGNLLLEA